MISYHRIVVAAGTIAGLTCTMIYLIKYLRLNKKAESQRRLLALLEKLDRENRQKEEARTDVIVVYTDLLPAAE